MDYTVHGILQARILEWVAFSFSRGSSQSRYWTQVSHIAGGFFTSWATKEAQALLWRPTRPSRTNTQKRCPLHYRGIERKSRKSRPTRSNRQIWPWSKKQSRSKTNRALPREHTGQSKHPLPTKQNKTLHVDIARWSIPKSDWLYSLQPKREKLYAVSKTRLGPDCGSDHELLIVRFRLKPKQGKPLDHSGIT